MTKAINTKTKTFYSRVLAFAKKTIKESADKEIASSTESINQGGLGTIRYYLDRKSERKLDKGEITLDQAKAIAIERMANQVKAASEKTLAKLSTASGTLELPEAIRIDIEWRKTRMWGNCPTAEVWAGGCYTTSKLSSGYGFDKESTVTANCFNDNPAFARIVAACAYLDSIEGTRTYGYYFSHNGAIFEGAVGFNCHQGIIERAGYELTGAFHPDTADGYRFKLK